MLLPAQMEKIIKYLFYILILLYCNISFALIYNLPEQGNDIVGNIKIIQPSNGNSFYNFIRQNEMGEEEIKIANPQLSKYKKLSANQGIIIPTYFILPPMSRKDIIINLPELRLYYYPPKSNVVITEPVAIGRLGWETPLIKTKVIEKVVDPYWIVPDSILKYSASKGIHLPGVVPPGPKNPLGKYALRLSVWSLLIHGTNQPITIGNRVSSGCIRMYPEDIEYLFSAIDENTPVVIINQPYKVGWKNNKLYLEVHKPLQETIGSPEEEIEKIKALIKEATQKHPIKINWKAVATIVLNHNGVPNIIGS